MLTPQCTLSLGDLCHETPPLQSSLFSPLFPIHDLFMYCLNALYLFFPRMPFSPIPLLIPFPRSYSPHIFSLIFPLSFFPFTLSLSVSPPILYPHHLSHSLFSALHCLPYPPLSLHLRSFSRHPSIPSLIHRFFPLSPSLSRHLLLPCITLLSPDTPLSVLTALFPVSLSFSLSLPLSRFLSDRTGMVFLCFCQL